MANDLLPPQPPPTDPEQIWRDHRRDTVAKRLPLICLVSVLGVGAFAYRLIALGDLEQSGSMFVGLPMLLAILLSLMPASKSFTGAIMKGITIFLLLLGGLMIEGVICILMAAPIFYLVGLIVGLVADATRRSQHRDRLRTVILLPLALFSIEGVKPWLSFDRDEVIEVSVATPLPVEEAITRLEGGPAMALRELPLFLKLGFPQPTSLRGDGLKLGHVWQIHFEGGEGEPGDLAAKVTESTPGHYVVTRTTDSSHISNWLDWKDAEWNIDPSANGSTVRLRMRYKRLLDPAIYFRPMERLGVRKAGEYFLQQTFLK